MYEIEVKWGNRRIVTAQRYSAFFSLHSALVAAGVEEPDTASLFPPKTWFRSLDPDLLEARRVALGSWLDAVLSRMKGNAAREDVQQFLGLR